jgi:uncharacterized protein
MSKKTKTEATKRSKDCMKGNMNSSRQPAQLHNDYLGQITSILARVFKDKKCSIYLFGSRATGDHTKVSDFDIGVFASGSISHKLSAAREELESSNIPFTVDLVDLTISSEAFSRKVQQQGILIWSN